MAYGQRQERSSVAVLLSWRRSQSLHWRQIASCELKRGWMITTESGRTKAA
jgi:hypothetical protein